MSLYFKKRRSLANGIAMCGSGVGVFVLSPLLKYLTDQYDWDGAVLILAGIALNGLVAAALYRPLPLVAANEFGEAKSKTPAECSDSGIAPHEADANATPVHDSHPPDIVVSAYPSRTYSASNLNRLQNKHLLRVGALDADGEQLSSSNPYLQPPLPAHLRPALHDSSSTFTRSGYWDNVRTPYLSHVDLCQIGSMLTIPTLHSGVRAGNDYVHSRSLMSVEEPANLGRKCRALWRRLVGVVTENLGLHLLMSPIMVFLTIASVLWTGECVLFGHLTKFV